MAMPTQTKRKRKRVAIKPVSQGDTKRGREGKDLVYAGKVDLGFDNASARDLQARLTPLIRKTQPQEDRAPWHMGRAVATGRNRVPGEIG